MVHRKKQSAATAKGTHEVTGGEATGAGATNGAATGGPVVVVAGPTASGKSAAALAIAREFDGTVINADSMQIYQDLAILSARPGIDDLLAAPHRLYGVLDAATRCSAGRWQTLAARAIDEAHGLGRLPIVAGGTGLYLKTMMQGIAPTPDIPEEVRARATARLNELGPGAFHDELARLHPGAAAGIRPTDRQRLLRAWEVLTATGRSLRSWQQDQTVGGAGFEPRYRFCSFLFMPDRADLYRDCDLRFGEMIEAGAVAETAALLERKLQPDRPAMKAVGIPEIARYLGGEWSHALMIDKGQQATRRYAKRQYTWFGKQMESDYRVDVKFSEREKAKIFSKIREFLLTAHDEGLR